MKKIPRQTRRGFLLQNFRQAIDTKKNNYNDWRTVALSILRKVFSKGGDDMKKFFALVALMCTVMISSTALAANWVWLYSDSAYTIYVDNDSICRDRNYSGYVFRAFVKFIYNDVGRNRVIERLRSQGQSLPKGIYNLADSTQLLYFKVADGIKYFSVVNLVWHTRDGKPIPEMDFSRSEPQWSIISSGTINEVIFKKVSARVPN